jgi:hypothetical protein
MIGANGRDIDTNDLNALKELQNSIIDNDKLIEQIEKHIKNDEIRFRISKIMRQISQLQKKNS